MRDMRDKVLVEFKREERRRKRKQKLDEISQDIKDWWDDNSEWAVWAIPLGITVTARVFNAGMRMYKAHQTAKLAEEYYDRRVYDPKTGMHWTTKRPMTADDKANYSNLKTNFGYSSGDALKKLNLI